MSKLRYLATRWSSPWEWSINSVPADTPLGQVGDAPCFVFETFGVAKAWLSDQTKAWVDGFTDDAREIRHLRRSDVEPASPEELAINAANRRHAAKEDARHG